MSKEKNQQKSDKKKPAKNLKEKRADKKSKSAPDTGIIDPKKR